MQTQSTDQCGSHTCNFVEKRISQKMPLSGKIITIKNLRVMQCEHTNCFTFYAAEGQKVHNAITTMKAIRHFNKTLRKTA